MTAISLLDYFAGKALEGWVSGLPEHVIASYVGDDRAFAEHQLAVAEACYGYAEAMIIEGGRRVKEADNA